MLRKTAILGLCLTPVILAAGDPVSRLRQPPSFAKPTAFGAAETLSATIKLVDLNKNVLFVRTSTGVSYSIVLTVSTRISSGNQRIKPADIPLYAEKTASVKFIPTRHGNMAQSIEIAP